MPNALKRSEVERQMMSRTFSIQHITDFESSKQGSTENWFQLREERRLQALSRLSSTLIDKTEQHTIFSIGKDTLRHARKLLGPERVERYNKTHAH